jgi:hypothetical protein
MLYEKDVLGDAQDIRKREEVNCSPWLKSRQSNLVECRRPRVSFGRITFAAVVMHCPKTPIGKSDTSGGLLN